MLRIMDGEDLELANRMPHPTIVVSFDNGRTWVQQKFCGYSHCDGDCGLSALTIANKRARGSMVAMGMVFSDNPPWTGERVEVPAELQELALKMWWN